jgi:ubiquinone/menaquinone biosynthesis C-methylase UbiE
VSHEDITQERFAAAAGKLAELGATRIEGVRERLRSFVGLRGDETALDVGTGTGTLALALAPLVREVVGIDIVPAMLAHARRAAEGVPNLSFVEGDLLRLPYEDESFDLVVTSRTIHHVRWPEIAVAEMARVARTRGKVLVVDQLAAADPLDALAHNRIEHLRDPSHVRVLSDQDFRGLFDTNELVLRRFEAEREEFELDRFLDLASCDDDVRAAVYAEAERLLSIDQHAGIELRHSPGGYGITLTIGWYLLEKVPPPPATTST